MGKMTVSQQIKIFLFKNVPSSDGVIQSKPDIKFELESDLRDHSEKDKPAVPLILMYVYLNINYIKL